MTTADLSFLDPRLQPLCKEWMDQCVKAGLAVSVTYTWRSPDEQNALFAKGRDDAGNIIDKKAVVTNLRGTRSEHCCMLDGKPASKAFDFAIYKNGVYITDGTAPEYKQAGQIAKDLGLVWGGDFVHPRPDYDHIELKP